ncbi:MAG: hypothetical protein QM820_56500 [Minicystis sp.]
MSRFPFNPQDPAVRAWLVSLNVALDDIDAVTRDLLRPLRQRELGHLKHLELYDDGWSKIMRMMGRDLPPDPEPDGSGPKH